MTHWATPLIGKPWLYGAQGPDAFDCWGFVRFVQHEQYGVELPDVVIPDTTVRVAWLMANHEEHLHWTRVQEPADGDIVMMARNRLPVHIGIAVQANGHLGVLHCLQLVGVVFQPLQALRTTGWGSLTYYRRVCPTQIA